MTLMLFAGNAYGVFYEIGTQFSYKKQVYGNSRQNKNVARTYSGSLAVYLFEQTGIEFNGSRTDYTDTQNESGANLTSSYVGSYQSRSIVEVFGVGIRQQLAPRKSFLVPMVSLGYAKQFIRSERDYTIVDGATKVSTLINVKDEKNRVDSMFGTFTLKINFTELMGITGSVNTVFKAQEYNEAKNNLTYSAGLSWIF